MTNQLKLINPQKFSVGVKTLTREHGFNINPGSFAMVSAEDIAYLSSNSSLLSRGILRVENPIESGADYATEVLESIGIDPETNPNFISDDEIRQHLSQSPKKIGEWLDTVSEGYIQDRIYDVVVSLDNLPVSKLKVIKEKMPTKDFIGE